jgi:two-component system sensor histidine kinase CiaH
MIRRLRWKVIGLNMGMVFCVLLAVFAAVYFSSRAVIARSVQQQLQQVLQTGSGYDLSQPGQEGVPCFVAEVYASGTVRVSGNSYYDLTDKAALVDIVTAALSADSDEGVLAEHHLRYLRQTGLLSTRIAFTDSTLEQATLRSLLTGSLLIGLAALAVLFACSYVLSGAVTRPVDRAWQQQKQFLSDASHELKTPLTVILSSAELLEQSAAPEQKQYVDNVRAESRRMKRLVEDMLTLSRVERGGEHLPDTTADLSDAAADAALRFEPVAYEAGHTLSYDIAPGLLVRGDSGKLEQAVAVLLDNAIKYAAPGTEVRLDAARQGKNACLWVENEGDPIPADKLPHIFDRFYRADASRTDGGSFGLGLPIARAIVEAHRGTLRCDSGGHTTRFTITLPCRQGK